MVRFQFELARSEFGTSFLPVFVPVTVAPPGGAAPLYQSGIKVERRPSRAGVPHSHRGTLHWQHTEKIMDV